MQLLDCTLATMSHTLSPTPQEVLDKAPALPADVQWHFIGHLQSNKVTSVLLTASQRLGAPQCMHTLQCPSL